jgi:LmbE family N-acetylglucosaminyl deacetylase
MTQSRTALAFLAHPDDAEFTCAGTLALLRERKWQIHIATMTPGQCGSAELSPKEISAVRRKEAKQAAELLAGEYHCLELEDCFIRDDRSTVLKAIALVRRIRPALVFAHNPSDYLLDHERSSAIVRDAAFWAGVPNIKIDSAEPLSYVPHLYYVDPVECKDMFGNDVVPGTLVDISSVSELKRQMLLCHASQREWLSRHHGMDEYTNAMQSMGETRGKLAGCTYAEGFRQHVGHGYPQSDLIAAELDDLTTTSSK